MRRFVGTYTWDSTDTTSLDLPLRSLAGLPPMVIEAAGHDLLADDARALAQRARGDGVEVVAYTEHPGQAHVFHIMAGLIGEANRAIDRFAKRLRTELDTHRIA
jgi:acetyl esterase/lipase